MIRVVAVIQGKLWSSSGGVGSNRTSDTIKCSVVKLPKKANRQRRRKQNTTSSLEAHMFSDSNARA